MSNEHDGYGVSAEAFQEIIRERKAEKNKMAEEKRVEILKSIRDRKSKSGIDPLDQFPKEVWEMILDKLDQPKDLGDVSQVHGLFEDLLESRKIRDILLPQLVGFPIQTDPDPYAEILPLARDLNMRSISKSMRNGVDRWYEDNLLHHLRTGKNVDRYNIPTICLQESKVLKGVLDNYVGSGSDESKAKRILQRSICTILSAYLPQDNVQEEEKRRFQEQCTRDRNDIKSLLEVIGDQVWHFQYLVGSIDSLEARGITIPQIYDTLLEWVELMPNLKWLEINVGGGWRHPERRKGVSIKSYLVNHPFPTLEHLERVDVELDSSSIEMFEVYDAIFSANRHLRRLHIDGYNDDLLERLPVAHVQQMDSLETFCVGNKDDHYFKWHLIQPLVNFQWHLKQIQLSFWLEEDITLTNVFQFFEKFQTLENVALNIMEVRITGDLKFLELPNLTEFELTFNPIIDFQRGRAVQFFFSLQFLLYCKNLKKLYWENENQRRDDRKLRRFMTNRECHGRMINFRGGYRNLNYSNIWDVFPYLDTIEVCLAEFHSTRNRNSMIYRTLEFNRVERDLPNNEDVYLMNRTW